MPAPSLPADAYKVGFPGPDAVEQLLVELINRARMDPLAEAARLSDDLASGSPRTPVQPLAVVRALDLSAQAHSDDMEDQDYFSHTGLNGSNPTTRAAAFGFTAGVGENLAWSSRAFDYSDTQISARHTSLWGSDGHQRNMLNAWYSELGVGFTSDRTGSYVTETFANRGYEYLTGVVIDDLDNDQFYDVGEGLGAVRITAWNDQDSFATSTWASGGYSLRLDPGTYTVRFEGGALDGFYQTTVTIGEDNVKLDVIEDRDAQPLRPTIYGNGNDNKIMGSGRWEDIKAGAGDDVVFAQVGHDTVHGGTGDDRLFGGKGNDTVWGGQGNDDLFGEKGNDRLFGGDGNDDLFGGKGNDTLAGQKGFDTLTGGKGADTFRFDSTASSRPGERDIIKDFGTGGDVIDLSRIDAITGGGDSAFTFIGGSGFSGQAGELRFSVITVDGVQTARVNGDTDGDGQAEFSLFVQGETNLSASDFIL